MFIHCKLFFAVGNYLKEKRDFRALHTEGHFFILSLHQPFSPLCFFFLFCLVCLFFIFTSCSVSEKGAGQFSKAQHSTAEYLQGKKEWKHWWGGLGSTFDAVGYKTWILNHSEKLEMIYLQSKNFWYLIASCVIAKVTRQHS